MRNLIPAAALALALGGCSDPVADPRGVDRDEVLVQVSATGRAEARPDEARFSAGVETLGASAADASARNSATINRVVAALARLGVKPDDIQTQSLTLGRIDYGPERGRYRASNLVEVRIRDLRRAGEAIAATTDAGANVVSGPNLRVSDPEAAARAAHAAAYRAARARAEAYAGAAGLRVARVLAIRDGDEIGPPIAYDTNMEFRARAVAQTAAPAPPVQPGISTREVRIRVDFALAR